MTNTNICADVISKYIEQLYADFKVASSDKGCFLLTPFDRPDGEGIELELEILPDGHILISDMGDTLGYLYVNGLTLSRTMLDRAKRISNSYGVSLEGETLYIEVKPEIAGKYLHQLIQSILSVTDLIQLRRSTNSVRFDREVEFLVIRSGATYDAEYVVRGKRENHKFRFHVNSGRNLLVQPITASTESSAHAQAERWGYRFLDIAEMGDWWHPVAVLDDKKESSLESRRSIWTPHALAPIQEYAILWSERDKLLELLRRDQLNQGTFT